jgi:hypothetical protein
MFVLADAYKKSCMALTELVFSLHLPNLSLIVVLPQQSTQKIYHHCIYPALTFHDRYHER